MVAKLPLPWINVCWISHKPLIFTIFWVTREERRKKTWFQTVQHHISIVYHPAMVFRKILAFLRPHVPPLSRWGKATRSVFFQTHKTMETLPHPDSLSYLNDGVFTFWGVRSGPLTRYGESSQEKTTLRQVIMSFLTTLLILDLIILAVFSGRPP